MKEWNIFIDELSKEFEKTKSPDIQFKRAVVRHLYLAYLLFNDKNSNQIEIQLEGLEKDIELQYDGDLGSIGFTYWCEDESVAVIEGNRVKGIGAGTTKLHVKVEWLELVCDIQVMEEHDWDEPVYTWSGDNSTVTASRVCANDTSHIETETAHTSMSIAIAPTEELPGSTEYHAAFINTVFEPQSCVIEGDIPALNAMYTLLLPDALTNICEGAFKGIGCQAVIVPDGCQSIGAHAFAECKQLIYIYIPASVISIAPDAFDGCPLVRIERATAG